MANDTSELRDIRERLAAIGQDHVLRFWGELPEAGRAKLLGQLSQQNLPLLAELAERYVKNKPKVELPAEIRPPKVYPRVPTGEHAELYARARTRGMELLMGGKVGAFLVAGGQGTRLGYDGPKGEFPVTPVRNKPLFQVFAEQLLFWGRTTGHVVPWAIMTSELNDAATRAFFERHGHFGYPKDAVIFFRQGMVPAFSFDGRLLLEAKDSLALAADGHGGSLTALKRSGTLDLLRSRGIEHLSYFQVDNPLVYCIDPLFLGLHDLTGSEMSSKTVTKSHALEKVGNFCVVDGKLQVIEYSDLPETLATKTNPDGTRVFNYGSIAIHAMRLSFIERLTRSGSVSLPWHRAEKKVACIDDAGQPVRPEKPNAVKLEQFVFDAIPLAENPIVFETLRDEEFSPVKNADGADSPLTSRRDQSARARRWLRAAGVAVDDDATVEISPLYAPTQETFLERGAPAAVVGKTVYVG